MNIFKGKYKIWLLIALIAIIFVIPQFVAAGEIMDAVAQIISSAVLQIVNFLVGWLISLLIKVFVAIAQYNQFIASAAVSKGWIIIRDVFNMFFVIALLIIAFSTVLGIQKYHYKQILLSLLIAAVLVNFSKLICGILIDISQVLMLTFVSAFKDVAGGNLIEMMGLKGLFDLKATEAAEVGGGQILGATLLALIMATVSVVVIGVIVMILIFRIIWLWFLVVLSPLAFVASVFPGQMQTYSKKWWKTFTKQVIIGPVLAFCLWLSFAVVQQGDIGKGVEVEKEQASSGGGTEQKISEAASPQYILNFMLGIGMLVGSLMVAETLGVAGAGIAAKAKGKLEAYAKGEKGPMKKVKQAGKVAKGVAKGAGKAALKAPGRMVGGGLKAAGKKMQEKGKEGGVMAGAGKVAETVSEPVKNIQSLKSKTAEYFKEKGKARRERIAKGKGSITDKAINAIGEDYKSEGWSERRTINAAHLKKVKDKEKEYEDQGADNNRLKYNLKNGSQTDAEAAASMLARRGVLKDDPETFELARKRIQAGGNKELNDKFDKNAKKTMDPDTLTDSVYNGFERGAKDFKQVLKDVKAGDLDINKFLEGISDEQFDTFMTIARQGEGEGAMAEIFNQMDGEEFEKFGNKLQRTEKGRKRLNEMIDGSDEVDGMDNSVFEDEKDKQSFIKATGRFDFAILDKKKKIEKEYNSKAEKIKTSDEFSNEKERKQALEDNQQEKEEKLEPENNKIDKFISEHKNVILDNMSEKSAQDQESIKTLLNNDSVKGKDIDNLSGKIKNKVLDTLSTKLIPEFNKNGNTSDLAKKARKIYIKSKKNIAKVLDTVDETTKEGEEIINQISTQISEGNFDIEDVIAKNKVSKMDKVGESTKNKTLELLANTLGSENLKTIRKQGNKELVEEIIKLQNKGKEKSEEGKVEEEKGHDIEIVSEFMPVSKMKEKIKKENNKDEK